MTLSDKRTEDGRNRLLYRAEDVKQSVKRILKKLKNVDEYSDAGFIVEEEFGDKLIPKVKVLGKENKNV